MSITIMENLWQVGGDDLSATGDAAVYLVRFGDSAALVDAGTGEGHRHLKENIARCLPPEVAITHLFITHCHYDHTGGAQAVRDDFGCAIVAHALDAAFLASGDNRVTAAVWYGARLSPLHVDMMIDDEQSQFTVGDGTMHAIHCPGHSPGSMVYTTTIDSQRVLFGQDVHGPIHPALASDESEYQRSLKKMLALEADLLLEGHFGIYRGKTAVRQFIQSYIR